MSAETEDLLMYICYEADAPFETLLEMALAVVRAAKEGEKTRL